MRYCWQRDRVKLRAAHSVSSVILNSDSTTLIANGQIAETGDFKFTSCDGSTIRISFPVQTEDNYKRMLMMEEVLKKRMVMVEADGGIHCIPLENIKYLRLYPATEHVDAGVIKGAKFLE